MKNILILSIHKNFSDMIIAGSKTWEYRKVIPARNIDEILFYSTEQKMFTVLAKNIETIKADPEEISLTHVDSVDFVDSLLRYFGRKEKVVAFKLNSVHILLNKSKKNLEILTKTKFKAPQGYKYINENDEIYEFIKNE